MAKRLLIVCLTITMLLTTGSVYALEKTDIYLAIDDSARQYDHINVKTVSLGRTNRETLPTANSEFYNQFMLMNFVYTGQVLISATWHERGEQENPVHNVSLVVSEDTLREKTKSGGINVVLRPDRIDIQ